MPVDMDTERSLARALPWVAGPVAVTIGLSQIGVCVALSLSYARAAVSVDGPGAEAALPFWAGFCVTIGALLTAFGYATWQYRPYAVRDCGWLAAWPTDASPSRGAFLCEALSILTLGLGFLGAAGGGVGIAVRVAVEDGRGREKHWQAGAFIGEVMLLDAVLTIIGVALLRSGWHCDLDERPTIGVLRKHNLQRAAERGDVDGIERLLQEGADVNAWRRDATPLLTAARYGRIHAARALLAAGAVADIRIRRGCSDDDGKSAEEIARSSRDYELADLIHSWSLRQCVIVLWATKPRPPDNTSITFLCNGCGCCCGHANGGGGASTARVTPASERLMTWRRMPRNVVAEVVSLLVPLPKAPYSFDDCGLV